MSFSYDETNLGTDTASGRINATRLLLGDTVKVVSTQKIYHADTLVCYTCQVRE